MTDSVKKPIALSEKYRVDSKNIYFLMVVRSIGIYFQSWYVFWKNQRKATFGYMAKKQYEVFTT